MKPGPQPLPPKPPREEETLAVTPEVETSPPVPQADGEVSPAHVSAELERRLDPAVFFRVHRSAIVRRDECEALRIEGDSAYSLRLRNGDRVSVSSRYVKEVRAELGGRTAGRPIR